MSVTVQQCIDDGYAKSAAARVESIASPQELIVRVGQYLNALFLLLSRENPFVLGTVLAVPFNGTGWSRPGDCLRVIQVSALANTLASPPLAPGKLITIVPFNDLGFTLGAAALTELGQQFVATGQPQDPTGGPVQMVYARAPIRPALTTDLIDALIPDTFALNLFGLDLAEYLATKDARGQDVATFAGLKAIDTAQLVEWAQGQTYTLQQRFPVVTPPLTNTAGGKQSPAGG